ncbi:MAG: hypothetical protein ACRD12_11830 [Acidimicrobiales bacterium]
MVDDDGGATIPLGGFDDRAIDDIVSGLGMRPLTRKTVRRLRDHTGGNPRYLRALIEETEVDALDPTADVPWPAPRAFSRALLDRLASCPPTARRLVAAPTAVVGMRSPLTVARPLASVGETRHALQAVIDAGLVE